MHDQKFCHSCATWKPLADFGERSVGGKRYPRTQCRKCEGLKGYGRELTLPPEALKKRRRATYLSIKNLRDSSSPSDLARVILYDSKKSDRKLQRSNDLDREFIQDSIANGCSYCGETELRMTLDRIDNEQGHLKSNVVPACIRCNLTRGNMPYQAWLVVSKGMQVARETGLFGGWVGRLG